MPIHRDGRGQVVTSLDAEGLPGLNPRPDLVTPKALDSLRMVRLARVQANFQAADCAGALLYDPINVRYATDARNMQVWTMHNPVRYVFVPANGPAVLFDYRNSEHMSTGLPTIGEVRRATTWHYFYAVSHIPDRVRSWANEIIDLVVEHGGNNRRLAVDTVPHEGVVELTERGVSLINGQGILERARSIKNSVELDCIRVAIDVCEEAIEQVRAKLEPSISENALWAIFNQHNALNGGEYIETKLLSSGSRTNPWYQESTSKKVRAGELVAFDTDMIGPYGYDADISRTIFCEPGKPTGEQRTLYALAHEQLMFNLDLLRPGLSFHEFSERSWKVPDQYKDKVLAAVLHGVGMCNEYPLIVPEAEFVKYGYDGYFEENMVVCLECYIGLKDGVEGVKLEDMVLITEDGAEVMSKSPFDDLLLA